MDRLSHRKNSIKIELRQKDGTVCSGKEVKFHHIKHDFLFGCNAFDSLALCDPNTDPKRKEILSQRMDLWANLFNFATLPFYWDRYEPVQGATIRENMLAAARFLKDKEIILKGHPLCWHTVCADWLMELSDEDILKTQLERIHRETTEFKGLIDMWDVINEVVIMPVFDKYDNAITRICKEYGRIGLIKKVFEAANQSNPQGIFLLNDFNTSQAYEILIEGCLEAGVPITHIGIQSHQHQGFWGLEKLHEILERFSRFNLPIHFTENTLISGELMPAHIEDLNDYQVKEWPTTREGEERQAREIVQMYTALFEHPLVEAVTTWDFDDDDKWLGAPCGLIRKDNTPKPAYIELENLIKNEWSSKGKLVSDEKGIIHLEGFKGIYELECMDKIERVNTESKTEFTWILD